MCEDGLMSPASAAKFLDVSVSTIYQWVYKGDLPSIKVGGTRRIPRAELVKILNDKMVGAGWVK